MPALEEKCMNNTGTSVHIAEKKTKLWGSTSAARIEGELGVGEKKCNYAIFPYQLPIHAKSALQNKDRMTSEKAIPPYEQRPYIRT